MPGAGQGRIGPSGLFNPGTHLAASQQFGLNQTDVFAVDKNGTLQVVWVFNAGAWAGRVRLRPPIFPPGAPVAASQQFGISQTDVFAADRSGTMHVAWVVNAGAWSSAPIVAVQH